MFAARVGEAASSGSAPKKRQTTVARQNPFVTCPAESERKSKVAKRDLDSDAASSSSVDFSLVLILVFLTVVRPAQTPGHTRPPDAMSSAGLHVIDGYLLPDSLETGAGAAARAKPKTEDLRRGRLPSNAQQQQPQPPMPRFFSLPRPGQTAAAPMHSLLHHQPQARTLHGGDQRSCAPGFVADNVRICLHPGFVPILRFPWSASHLY